MRTITSDEYEFLVRIESNVEKNLHSMGLSKNALVEPMADGDMGSLRFENLPGANSKRCLGEIIAQGEFDDLDGVPVSFTINMDSEGKLFELDLWRVDFEPLQRLPAQGDEIRMLSITA